jgi:hypothetical protein
MTDLERDILAFILRALLRAGGPMCDSTLRAAVRNAFAHIAFTAAEITARISQAEESQLIAGVNDEVFGLMWDLTPRGKIKAQLLK